MADLSIADVRAKFPQYKDLSDDQLAQGLHQKFYSDMPYEDFSKKIGLAQPSKLDALGSNISQSPVTGGAEMLAHHATGLLAPIPAMLAGAGASVGKLAGANVDPDQVYAKAKDMFTYAPMSQSGRAGIAAENVAGQKVSEVAAPVVQPVVNAGNAMIDKTGAAAPYVRDVVHGVAGGVANAAALAPFAPAARVLDLAALPEAEQAAFRARPSVGPAPVAPAAEGAAKPVVGTGQDAIETGRAAGFKFTPGAVESRQPGGKVPQAFSVTPDDRRAINLHNQARATELAGEHIGVQGAKTLPNAKFEEAKVPHFETYTETGKALGDGLKGSDDLVGNLEGMLADQTPQGALKPAVATQAKRILAAAKSGNMSGPQMVKDISWLRANGGRSVASQLENEVEGQLSKAPVTPEVGPGETPYIPKTPAGPQQLEKFRDARQSLAQINDLQRAAAKGGGQISLPHLVAIDAKNPNLLTGTPKLLAQTAAAAPQDFRLPSGVQPGSSPLSGGVLGKIPLIGKGTEMALAAGEKAIKYGAKKLAPGTFDPQSAAFQNKFGREAGPAEKTYFKDLGKRPAPASKAFELQPAPGKAFSPSQRGLGDLQQGPGPREQLELMPPEGSVYEPHQIGMQVPQGPPAREVLGLQHPEGNVGVNPTQIGMELAQGRPMGEQRLGLEQSPAGLEPHQPSLLGHEGTPEGGSRKSKPKAKKHGADKS